MRLFVSCQLSLSRRYNMAEIFLSIAVITYNQEKYIAQTLDSIIGQKHNYSFEIVVGDDCSTDGTKTVIADYAKRYPDKVKAIYNEHNIGVVANYYNVLSHCYGKYIMECAGDDWWLPGKVDEQITFMENHDDVGLCYGTALCYNDKNEYLNRSVGAKCSTFEELMTLNLIPAVTVCFKRELVKKYINEVNPVSLGWKMEDYPMWLWFSKNSKITYLSKSLACYRCADESVSNSKNIEKQFAFFKSTYDVQAYYAVKYGYVLKTFESDEMAKSLMFRTLLKSYDSEKAKEMRSELIKSHSFKDYIKSIIISNRLLAKIGSCFI